MMRAIIWVVGLAAALAMLALWRRSTLGAATAIAGITLTALLVAQTPIGRHAAVEVDE